MTKQITRLAVLIMICLLSAAHAYAQDDLRFADLGDFRLENGQVMRQCRIGYRTVGQLNSDKTNAILFPTYFAGTSKDLMGMAGPGKLFDSSKYFVIVVDAFGNGISSSPSNSKAQPGRSFPEFSIRDLVAAQHQMVVQELKLNHLYAVVGISMGGMQAFQWMISYPDFMDLVIPIIGTPRQTSYDLLLWKTQLLTIESNRDEKDGEAEAMRIVAGIQALAIQTPAYVAAQIKPEGFEQFLAAQQQGIMRLSADNYSSQLRAMINHDIFKSTGGSVEQAAKIVKAKVLVIVAEQDHMVNPKPALEFAKAINAETVVLSSNCGHLAPGCEVTKVGLGVSSFLANRRLK
jgi:homoserine acetyltransferase